MAKSPDAFRTISEVADWLGIQAHVLRFWESKFTQIKPIKRAGGRRYYRPVDMLLLGGIKKLLHEDGLTIKGVQKILREQGMSHVSDMSGPLDEDTLSQLDDAPVSPPEPVLPVKVAEEQKGVVLHFETPVVEEPVAEETAESEEAPTPVEPDETAELLTGTDAQADVTPTAPVDVPEEPKTSAPGPVDEVMQDAPAAASTDMPDTTEPDAPPRADENIFKTQEPVENDTQEHAQSGQDEVPEASPVLPDTDAAHEPPPAAALPAFLRRPLDEPEPASEPNLEEATDAPEQEPVVAETEPEVAAVPPPPKPRIVELPTFLNEADIDATAGVLSAAYARRRIRPENADQIRPLLARLTTLRDSMAARRRNADTSAAQD